MKTNNTIKNFAMRFVAIMAVVLLAGNAWGEATLRVTLTLEYTDTNPWSFPAGSSNKTTDSHNYTNGDYTINLAGGGSGFGHYMASQSVSGGHNVNYLIMGKSGATLTLPAFDFKTTKIEVVGRAGASPSVVQNIFVGDIAVSTATTGAGTESPSTAITNEYAINSNYQAPGTIYTLKVTSSHNTQITAIKIYGEDAGYAVSYNNGGHGSAPTGVTASSVQLSALTETGYTCTGWKANVATKVGTTDVAANTLISNGSTVTILAATTFTAQWSANTYQVAFDKNGGSGSTMSNQAFTYDEDAKALSANTYTAPADKYFYGWHRTKAQADLGNREYADKAEVQNLSSTNNETVTLYAAWKDYNYTNYRTTCVNKFYVTYVAPDKTDGNVPVDETEYSKNATVTVLGGGTLEKTHYAFAGWTDGDNDYVEDDEFTITKDVELAARWTCAEAVTIAKAASTAHGSFALSTSGELATCNDDVVVNVTSISPETGYEFSAITIDGVGTKDDNAKTVTYDQYTSGTSTINVTFAPKHITVTWDANEGSVSPASSEYIYDGSTVTLPTPERTGYVFDGWFTLAEGGDEITEIGTTNKPVANVTYHAHWHKANYTITWSVAGDDTYSTGVTDENNNADYEGTVSAPTAPENGLLSACQTDGKFVGWTASDAVYSNHPITSASDITALGIFTTTSPEVTGPTTFRAVYAVETTPAEENYLLQEEFDNEQESDASAAITTSTFANFNGATAKAYKGAGGSLKLGSSSDPGKITSTTLDLSENFKVRLKAKAYYGTSLDAATLYVKVGDDIQSVSTSSQTNALTGEYKTFVFDFDGTTETTVEIGTSAKRAYIDDVDIYTLTPAVYTNYMTECCPQRTITIADLDAAVGTINADVSSVCEGEQVTLTKTENHYNFTGWKVYKSGDATTTVSVTNNQFYMPDYNVTVEATWTPKNYEATLTAPNPADGSVLAEGGSIEQGHRYVAYGSTLTVTAEPADDDHYFQNWTVSPAITGLNTSNNPMTITMPGNNITVTANFGEVAYPALTLGNTSDDEYETDAYTLTVKLANGNDITNMGEIRSGTALMATYELKDQNEFVGWKMNDGAFTTFGTEGAVATFNMPDEDLNIDIDVLAYYTLGLSAEHGNITAVKKIVNEVAQDVAYPYHVHEGEKIEVIAEAESNDYKFKQWNKTGNTAAYDGSSTTAKLTIGTESITLEAVFEDKVSYNLTLVSCGKTQEVISAQEGTPIYSLVSAKAATALTGYSFVGWSETQDGDIISNDELKLNADKSVYAVYRLNAYYKKVTSISEGQYLIVYETGGLAFNGGRETLDATSNTIAVEIGNKEILVTDETTAAEFTIASVDGGYSIKSASGFYIGQTSNTNGLASTTSEEDAYVNTIEISDGDADIVSSSAHLRYNSSSGQERFRYFQSSTYSNQKAIQLYKRFAQGSEESNPSTVVANGEELVIDVATTLNNLTVEAGGKLNNTGNMTVNNLTIKSEAGNSGQVMDASKVTVNGNLYMDVTFFKGANTLDATTAGRWYMISAPFDVNLSDGFTLTDGTPMHFGVDDNALTFDLFEYDGKKRGETGVTGWKRVQGKMKAGTACLIGFNPGQPTTIRLKAASAVGEPNKITLQAFDGDADNANWNGVANPTLHYTDVDQNVQVYENEDGEHGRKYNVYAASDYSFVVGTAFFVQATGSIGLGDATHSTPEELRAPKRAEAEKCYKARVQIFRQEATEFADQMYVRASETATNEYEQGHDMITWNGTTANTAMIWAENYGKRLAIEEAPLVNNQASYALGIYAPKAGTYRIAATSENEGDLYLTQNGSIIWNLSMGAYELELTKGTTEGYGLLLQAKAPGAATGVDNIDASEAAQKVIIDDHVYILRNGQMYDVNGKVVK